MADTVNGLQTSVLVFAAMLCTVIVAGCSDDVTETGAATGDPEVSTAPSSTGPPATIWESGPDACSLLTPTEMRDVLDFELTTGPRFATDAEGNAIGICVAEHTEFGVEGGSISVAVIPPRTDLSIDRGQLTEVSDLADVGVSGYLGHADLGTGTGANVVVVDMGEGGFTLRIATLQDLDDDTAAALAALAADRWVTTP
jgi:hypothetical protein